jgi:hypothetical protein
LHSRSRNASSDVLKAPVANQAGTANRQEKRSSDARRARPLKVRHLTDLLYQVWYKLLPRLEAAMFGDEKERWMDLCELAAKEQDPAKLMALVAEINRILESKEQRLKQVHSANKTMGNESPASEGHKI